MYAVLILVAVAVIVGIGIAAFGGFGGDRVIYRRRRVAGPAYVDRPVVQHVHHEHVADCPECAARAHHHHG